MYFAGETFSATGMVVTAYYDNDTSSAITGYTISPSGALSVGDTAVTVFYEDKSAIIPITVNPVLFQTIKITTPPAKKEYIEGQVFSTAGMVVTAFYNDGTEIEITDYTISPLGALIVGYDVITVSYSGKYALIMITIDPLLLLDIAVTTPPAKTVYFAGEAFSTTGMAVTAYYNDGSEVVCAGWTISPSGALSVGDTAVTVFYEDKSAAIPITVNPVLLLNIAVTTGPAKTDYFVSQKFSTAGMVVTAYFNNGTSAAVTGYTVSPAGHLSLADTVVAISYNGQSAAVNITVSPVPSPLTGSAIFVQDTDGTDDGVQKLVDSMLGNGLFFYQTASTPTGVIASDDVVLLKINGQWPQRGGTNTDLLRGVIQAILDHPNGFTGEIFVGDNGHAQYSTGVNGGGSLEWPQANAHDRTQSAMRVINDFKAAGHKVTGDVWDRFTRNAAVAEFSAGNNTDGFVRPSGLDGNGWGVSYAKFTTEYGTRISFRLGIWDAGTQTYNRDKLKVINMPVLKYHVNMHMTGALKNYFGTHSQQRADNHGAIGSGGLARQMIATGLPALHIMDMIYVGTWYDSPRIPYNQATQVNKVAIANDPVALDYWASKYVLFPAYTNKTITDSRDNNRAQNTNPDANSTFGNYLRATRTVFTNAGIPYTLNESQFMVVENGVRR